MTQLNKQWAEAAYDCRLMAMEDLCDYSEGRVPGVSYPSEANAVLCMMLGLGASPQAPQEFAALTNPTDLVADGAWGPKATKAFAYLEALDLSGYEPVNKEEDGASDAK